MNNQLAHVIQSHPIKAELIYSKEYQNPQIGILNIFPAA
jgi:hypothetical protein